MKRLVTALAAGAAISTIAFASASVLGVDGSTIQHGSSGVSCDETGVDVGWGLETDDNSVRFVRVENIDPLCAGDTMFVKVDGVQKSATITGTSQTLNFTAPFPNVDDIDDINIWVEG